MQLTGRVLADHVQGDRGITQHIPTSTFSNVTMHHKVIPVHIFTFNEELQKKRKRKNIIG